MIITAKFESTCPSCSQAIEVGSNVEWSRGEKAKHEQCYIGEIEEQRLKRDAEQEAKRFRYGDRIEVAEDLYHHGIFGILEPELMARKGIKAKIYSEKTLVRRINGKNYECVQCEEIVRKNQQPKTKSGFFIAPLRLIKITKKAKSA